MKGERVESESSDYSADERMKRGGLRGGLGKGKQMPGYGECSLCSQFSSNPIRLLYRRVEIAQKWAKLDEKYCKSEVRLARSARGIVVDEGFAPYPYPLSGSGGSHQRMS